MSVGRGFRILVMDDDEGIQDVVRIMLGRLGYRVAVVPDGVSAVIAYQRAQNEGDPFDLVILDLSVEGGKGGLETLEDLKIVDPNIVALITTGFTGEPVFSRYREYGFAGAVAKPYRMKDLDDAIRAVLS
ncbi:MAG: response regulator [Methanolinea sp.]|nr:response regulator [Methanolinea sp.]